VDYAASYLLLGPIYDQRRRGSDYIQLQSTARHAPFKDTNAGRADICTTYTGRRMGGGKEKRKGAVGESVSWCRIRGSCLKSLNPEPVRRDQQRTSMPEITC
jgi:hypothetical protein